MIHVEWNWLPALWELCYDEPSDELRRTYGDWRQLTFGPLWIYWQKDPATPFEPRDKE